MACAQEDENSRILVITVGLLISCIFLAATLATYCCLPALQNLHGKTLMCHVSSLLVAYLFLALTQLLTRKTFLHNEWVCSIIGRCCWCHCLQRPIRFEVQVTATH